MEEACQENKELSKESLQSDILKDKNIKFDYSESVHGGGESKNIESYYDLVDFEANTKKYESIKGDSDDHLNQSIQQSCITQLQDQSRSRSVSMKAGKPNYKHVHFKERMDTSITEKNSTPQRRVSMSRENPQPELINSRRHSTNISQSTVNHQDRHGVQQAGLVQVPVRVSNLPESQELEAKEIYDRFMEIQLTEEGTEDCRQHEHPLSAEKYIKRPQDDDHEVDRVLFRPLLTKKSLQIASKLGDPAERLLADASVKKRRIEESVRHKMSFDCTFTPKINRKSRYLDERKMIIKDSTGLSVSRHDKLYLEVRQC